MRRRKNQEEFEARWQDAAPVLQGEEIVEARYCTDGLLPEHLANPLVSALGPYWKDADIARELHVPVGYSDEELNRSKEYRMHAIGRLENLVISLPAHLEVVHTTHRIIRDGYSEHSGNRLKVNTDELQGRYELSSAGELRAVFPHVKSHAACAALFGYSGVGKSTGLESALRTLPKAIRHPEHGIVQVVRIKIECPTSASLKDTLKEILLSYDQLLETTYIDELSQKATIADYANKVRRVARRHFTGVIVLDEIQNAITAAANNDPLFDFFVNFTNISRVPMIVSGTLRAERLFRKTLRLARRISSQGVIVWRGIRNADDWNRFCGNLSKYQWLANGHPLSAAERACLWSLSQGFPGIAVPLYQLAQYSAIATKREALSCQLLKAVFNEKMHALKPILRAIRSGSKAAMMKYDDILGDTLKEIVADMKAESMHNLFYDSAIRHDRMEVASDAVSSLIVSGIPQEVAQSMVALVQKQYPDVTREQVCQEVCIRYYSTRESTLASTGSRRNAAAAVETVD
ncbi:ATP-binding protein [Paraburkholderia hospita]|uniref:ATP-binding protein n=1 Tax=Paraburkholderia hospita TaxID=169430 RepID=UPI0009CF8094|nr:ATP-binding protein [Paraburkholderia hospita]SKC69875.1 AAA domain-containing protein [Paraburkholderia hospita]